MNTSGIAKQIKIANDVRKGVGIKSYFSTNKRIVSRPGKMSGWGENPNKLNKPNGETLALSASDKNPSKETAGSSNLPKIYSPDIFGKTDLFPGKGDFAEKGVALSYLQKEALSFRRKHLEALSYLQKLTSLISEDAIKVYCEQPKSEPPFKQNIQRCDRRHLKSVSKRNLARLSLKLVKYLPAKKLCGDVKYAVRLWKDKDGVAFYDCSCEGRIPIQDVVKIEKHLKVHERRSYVCSTCGKEFKCNHLQLNAHKKIHKKDRMLYS